MIVIFILILGYISFRNLLVKPEILYYKIFEKNKEIYIKSFSSDEQIDITSLLMVLLIFLIFNCYFLCNYKKTIKNIKNIGKINIVYFLFIILVLGKIETILKLKDALILSFYSFINIIFKNILGIIFVVIVYLLYERFKLNAKEDDDGGEIALYQSRKKYKDILESYLKLDYESVALTGEWGSGKSYFIKYFIQEKLKDKEMEFILIDVSSYSTSGEVLKKIKKEIEKILKRNGVLLLKTSIFKDIIVENNIFNRVGNCILDLFEEEIDDGIEGLKDKKIILILDNIERINNKEKIVKIFSSVDEQLITKLKNNKDKLKIIYSYDEKYMELLFRNEKIDFFKYISKYTDTRIAIKEVDKNDLQENLSEGLKIVLSIILEEKREDNLTNFNKIVKMQIEEILSEGQRSYNNNDISYNEVQKKIEDKMRINYEEKLDEIYRKIINPRFVKQNTKSDIKIIKEKILLEIFSELSIHDLENLGTELFCINFKIKNIENLLEDKIVELFIFNYLFNRGYR